MVDLDLNHYKDGWLPDYTYVYNPRTGGTYDPEGEGYPFRIVGHTTETDNMPDVASHQYPPQIWYNPTDRQKLQTINLKNSGYALYQSPTAPYYTNRARALQVEVIGRAVNMGGATEQYLQQLAEDVIVPLVLFARSQGGDIDLSDPAVPLPGAIGGSANADAPQRLLPVVWAFGPVGYVGHRHVPMGDDHWDAGALNLRAIANYAKQILGSATSTTVPIPTQPRVLKDRQMDFYLRKNPDGSTFQEPSTYPGITGPVNYWDHPLVPAGMKIVASPMYPPPVEPAFNAVVILQNGSANPVQAPQLAQWGNPTQTKVMSDCFATVAVPAGFACRVVAVG